MGYTADQGGSGLSTNQGSIGNIFGRNNRNRYRGGFNNQNSKKAFKNLAKLQREKAELDDWQNKNKTERDWQTMKEKATIGDQELSRMSGTHLPNLMQSAGMESLSNFSAKNTAGYSVAMQGAKKEQQGGEDGPDNPVDGPNNPVVGELPGAFEPETTGAPDTPRTNNFDRGRTPTQREIRAGVALWKKSKGETGTSPEEGVEYGNRAYNAKIASRAAVGHERTLSQQFSPGGVGEPPEKA